MNPYVFRKKDARSCLVVDKTWDEIINRPDNFDELAERIVNMMNGAENFGLILKTTTFGDFKKAINQILISPLKEDLGGEEHIVVRGPNTILVDAFWDEIIQTEEKWVGLKDALARAYDMKVRIGEHSPLTGKDTLQQTKDNFNDTVVKPMLGINEDE